MTQVQGEAEREDSLLRVGERRLGSRCGGGAKLLLMTFIAVADQGRRQWRGQPGQRAQWLQGVGSEEIDSVCVFAAAVEEAAVC